jgi:tRNA A-37 threonylcarbamoyl transferase component Bud32
MTESTLPKGTIVAQRLQVVRVLGEGGMGAVYEVEHLLTKHRRALKLLHPELASEADVVERFLREASAAGRIGNAHIVETFDAGTTEDGAPYLVMEMLEGYSLSSYLIRRGRLEPAEAVEIFRQVCDGIQAAHDSGIVHRDLKPENIFLLRNPRHFVKILDFGISKFDPALTGTTASTLEGSVLGTPYYMSPEQVRGAKDVDGSADVYALGVVLYECLAGTRPFEAETLPHLAVLIAEGNYAPVSHARPGIPVELDEVIARALSANRAARYPSASAFAEALDAVVQRNSFANATQLQGISSIPAAPDAATVVVPSFVPARPAHAGTPAPVERGTATEPQRRVSGTTVALGVALLLAGAALAFWKLSPPPVTGGDTPLEPVVPHAAVPPAAPGQPADTPAPPLVTASLEPLPVTSTSASPVSPAPGIPKTRAGSTPAASAVPAPVTSRRSATHGLSEENPFR